MSAAEVLLLVAGAGIGILLGRSTSEERSFGRPPGSVARGTARRQVVAGRRPSGLPGPVDRMSGSRR